ncbi:MAG: alkaline phosphatase D family protein [Deltaproteobacteria bacterium]|nr:alkaline phosphatase D family protein [Deltaproteobacteria bacterium]
MTTSRRDFLLTSAASVGIAAACNPTRGPQGGQDAGPLSTTGDGGSQQVADGGGPSDAGTADAADAAVPDAAPPAPDAGQPVNVQDVPLTSVWPLGVAAGDTTPTSAMLWTQYTGFRTLKLLAWESADGSPGIRVADAEVAAEDTYVKFDVVTLSPGARYAYVFLELEDGAPVGRSPVGLFRAAIAEDAEERLLLGATSCTKNGRNFGTIGHAAGRADLDAFLLLGDTSYNDGAETLVEYRAKWAENLGTPEYRALREATAVYATWDDHEVVNDFTPEDVSYAKFVTAQQAFWETLPIRPHPTVPGRLWRSFRWGRTVEVFVLDCRGERRPSTRDSGNAEYLSAAQMSWLQEGLRTSPCVFKLIMNSVPIGNFPTVFDVARGDRWEGYPSQRTAILRFIDETPVTGVLWVSGDFHLATIGWVSAAGNPGEHQLEFLVGPGAQTGNVLASTLNPPLWEWATPDDNYATFDLDPGTRKVIVTFHAASGTRLAQRSFTV